MPICQEKQLKKMEKIPLYNAIVSFIDTQKEYEDCGAFSDEVGCLFNAMLLEMVTYGRIEISNSTYEWGLTGSDKRTKQAAINLYQKFKIILKTYKGSVVSEVNTVIKYLGIQ